MGVVHIPRTSFAAARGYLKRRSSPLTDKEKRLVGIGAKNPPHVYTSRAGLFDVDLMLHMNNASYLTHAELARWEWTAFTGMLGAALRTKTFFIVTASMVRFRREVAPLTKFQIETRVTGIDDRNLWVYQTFHNSNDGERGKVLAQVFTQAVMAKDKKVLDPRSWILENNPASKDALDDLVASSNEAIYDEKSSRFTHLEDALRDAAALRDQDVEK
ncbi:hypothetical protein ACHAWF_011327 [Thalassiosira exigua]